MKEIKVLGPGCAKCKSTYAVVENVVKELGMDVQLTKVEDIEEIMRYNIMSTPAIVIDGKVVMKGKVPSESEVKSILKSLTPDPSQIERM
ncbi:MAG: thioredoxin family protein [Prevotella sp.]